jgi:hypothetical protein
MVQWAAFLLDRLVAPKVSTLRGCSAPELAEPAKHFGSFFLNNVWLDGQNPALPFCAVYFRRLATAFREYRSGRERMIQCVNAQPHSNEMVTHYLSALTNFEAAIVNSYLALLAHDGVARSLVPNAGRSFTGGDGSPAQRLNVIYNALKHFDKNVLEGHICDTVAPVWLVDDGIECVGSEGPAKLLFSELVDLLGELDQDAKYLSEEVYKLAHERAKAKAKSKT